MEQYFGLKIFIEPFFESKYLMFIIDLSIQYIMNINTIKMFEIKIIDIEERNNMLII